MSENQSIFSVKFEKYTAELEISELSIRCVTGDITHWNIPISELRAYVQTSHNTVLFSFYKNELYQVAISSKHCISILNNLDPFLKKQF